MTQDHSTVADTATVPAGEVVQAFKGFDQNFMCRGFAYQVGKTYEHKGRVEACGSGFHACENPLDVLDYYPPATSRYGTVEQRGQLARHRGDSKVASSVITVKAELNIAGLVSAAVEYVKSKCDPAKSEHATGDSAASSATGYSAASSATGNSAASSATGDRAASSATGDRAASSATGDRAASSATGYSAASSATGDSAASSATGYRAASSATGYRAASLTTGRYSAAEIAPAIDGKPQHAVAIACGGDSKARAPAGSAIVLCERDNVGALLHIFASKVGENGIAPDTWYTLRDGKPVEAQS